MRRGQRLALPAALHAAPGAACAYGQEVDRELFSVHASPVVSDAAIQSPYGLAVAESGGVPVDYYFLTGGACARKRARAMARIPSAAAKPV
jgi:hypothetical protein